MPGPFPGMDPYLERGGFWQGFHNTFIAYLNGAINRVLPSRFAARSEVRVYIDQESPTRPVPDVSVFAVARPVAIASAVTTTLERPVVLPEEILLEERREAFLEILDRANGNRVVMVVEVLSPENKGGAGRSEYRRKQATVLQSQAHLLEIDLLRGGLHTVAAPEEGARALGRYAYLIHLADAHLPERSFVWRVGLRDPLPTLRLPLTEDAEPFVIDLQAVFDRVYEEGRYADLLAETYQEPPLPPLSAEDEAWVRARLEASAP